MVFEADSLSYGELDARSNQLAHHLRALGVGPEVVVGLCLERSLEMLVALLAILKAGGAYLPLDPDYPRERLAFMLADAGAPVLVTHSALRARLPGHGARIVCLDADGARHRATAHQRPRQRPPPQNPAYVIYTSGSTGTPKGVVVAHASLANLRATQTNAYADRRRDGASCSSHRIAFDASICGDILPPVHGAGWSSIAAVGSQLVDALAIIGTRRASPSSMRLRLCSAAASIDMPDRTLRCRR